MTVLFDPLREQVEQLIGVFGVETQASTILAAFDALCAESLHIDARQRTPELSRINVDGTPFQYSLSLGRNRRAPLQFLGEAGRPGGDIEERLKAGRVALARLAEVCGIIEESVEIDPLLRIAAPANDHHLLADRAGIFWFAVSFHPDTTPALTVYINGRWGPTESQWRRLEDAAAYFERLDPWRSLRASPAAGFAPLGMAVTLKRGEPPSGRFYLSAYGVAVNVYRSLFLGLADDRGADATFDSFVRHVIGADVRYPTRSAVFSVGLGPSHEAAPKLELCAHCALDHDVDAAHRISAWLLDSRFDDGLYDSVLHTLTATRPLSGTHVPTVHAYVGIGWRSAGQYASIYLNPGPGLAC